MLADIDAKNVPWVSFLWFVLCVGCGVCEGLDLLRGSPAPRASVTGPICWEGRSVARGESGCKEGKGSEG